MKENYMEFIQMTNELHERFNKENLNKPVNLNLLNLVIEGRDKLNRQLIDGKYRCYECSNAARSDVYHYNNPIFQDFSLTPIVRKHAKDLQELADYFYN